MDVSLILLCFKLLGLVIADDSLNAELGYCPVEGCPEEWRTGKESIAASSSSPSTTADQHFTSQYLQRSLEILRISPTFFAHLYQNHSDSLTYKTPAILFSYNALYIPGAVLEPPFDDFIVKYRCHHRDLTNLPTSSYHIESAPVKSVTFEPYFGIPTATDLEIQVARFVHNISLPCDQLSPLGLTSSDTKMNPQEEFAILVGNGHESRRVKYADLQKDRETVESIATTK